MPDIDPFASLPFGIGDALQLPNPILQTAQQRQQRFPLLPPSEQDSTLNRIGRGAVSGLGYLGGVLDKPGRAVRGFLGGKPEELLALLPFSDALGITDESNRVSGQDLLGNVGLVDPNDKESWAPFLAGIGTEIATDPLTWINPFAPLTKAGSIAKAAGILPNGLEASMRGVAHLEPAAAEALAGVGRTAADVTNQPLRSLFSVAGMPVGTGSGSQWLVGQLDKAGTALKTAETLGQLATPLSKVPLVRDLPNPVPYARGLFDASAGGVALPAAQKVFEEVVQPGQKAGQATAKEAGISRLRELEQAGVLGDKEAARAYRTSVEGLGDRLDLINRSEGINKAAEMGKQDIQTNARMLAGENDLGIPTKGYGGTTPEGEPLLYGARYNSAVKPGGGTSWRNQELLPVGHASQIAREEPYKGLPTDTLNSLYKDTRVSGPDALLKGPAASDLILREYLGGATTAEAKDQANALARKLAEANPEHAAKQIGLFEHDPVMDLQKRTAMSEKAKANALGAHTLYVDQAVDGFREGYVPADEALQKATLTFNEEGRGAKQTLANMLSQKFGRPVSPDELKNIYIRPEAVDAATKWMKPFVAPESVKPLVELYDKVTNLFKGMVTQAFPSYHVRNAASGVWQNWVTGAFDPTVGHGWNPVAYLKPYQDAKALADGKTVIKGIADAPYFKALGITSDEEATKALADLIHIHGAAGPGSLTQGAADIVGPRAFEDMAAKLPGSQGFIEKPSLSGMIPRSAEEANPLNLRGVTGDASKFAPVREGEKAQGYIEYVNRTANFIAQLKQGKTPEVAAALSKAAHLDYSMLSPFERDVARRVIPFYSWSRRNLPMVFESLINAPEKVAGTVRVANAGREQEGFLPNYIGEGAAVPLPGAPQGQQRFLSSFGLPVEDEFIGTIASLAKGDLQRAAERLAGTTAPQIKAPLEMLAGRQFYSGRELKDLQPSQLASLGGLLPNSVAQPLTQVVSNTPLTRFATIIDKLTDPRKDWGATGVNLLTGARITDADIDKAKEIEARKLVENMLTSSPNFKAFENVVPNKDNLQNMTPQELQTYRLYLGLQRDAEKAALRKQATAGDPKAAERLRRMDMEDRARGG